METLEPISFEDWVKYLFDHEVREHAWYWDDETHIELSPTLFIEYATRLFQNSGELTKPYSDGQIRHGIERVVSTYGGNDALAVIDRKIPIQKRLGYLKSFYDLNRHCFSKRCTPHLSHRDRQQTPENFSPLNLLCYMWWDGIAVYSSDEEPVDSPAYGTTKDWIGNPLDRISLQVMEQCLQIPNVAVQEGALHGLGHFHLYYPKPCKSIIRSFLAKNRRIDPDLRQYAENSAKGIVQ